MAIKAKTTNPKKVAKTSTAVSKKSTAAVKTAKSAVGKKSSVPIKKAVAETTAAKSKSAAKKTAKKTVVKSTARTAAEKQVKKTAEASVPAKKSITRVRKDEILKKLRLSKADKKFFYDLLVHARSAFGAQVQYHSDDALSRKDAAGERVGMATHMADLGTDNYRRDFELGLLSDGVDVLEMIDEALQRLEDSEYGICLDCGEPIPRKRLEAKPYAKYCTKCKSKREEMDETYYHRR